LSNGIVCLLAKFAQMGNLLGHNMWAPSVFKAKAVEMSLSMPLVKSPKKTEIHKALSLKRRMNGGSSRFLDAMVLADTMRFHLLYQASPRAELTLATASLR
jgi:hypothetical protein